MACGRRCENNQLSTTLCMSKCEVRGQAPFHHLLALPFGLTFGGKWLAQTNQAISDKIAEFSDTCKGMETVRHLSIILGVLNEENTAGICSVFCTCNGKLLK